MDREILFRGKRVDNGEWVYGGVYQEPTDDIKDGKVYIIAGALNNVGVAYSVDPATVGQYTGITDKNGTKIFEGDIIQWDEKEWGCPYLEIAEWDYDLFNLRKSDWKEFCEVVGNIYDTPRGTES